jgi:predicted SprT family Zn-dependent metalloprotease
MGARYRDSRQADLPFLELAETEMTAAHGRRVGRTIEPAHPVADEPGDAVMAKRGRLGSVADVAAAWNLTARLARAATIGGAYGECLECTVEVSNRAKVQAGVAYTEERRIVLNAKLLEAGREADRDATLLHECAHILANRRYRARCNHDHRWKRVMEMLGEPPRASHRLDYLSREAHAVVAWVCRNCGEAYHFVRPPRRRVVDCYCRHCGPRTGRLDVTSTTS